MKLSSLWVCLFALSTMGWTSLSNDEIKVTKFELSQYSRLYTAKTGFDKNELASMGVSKTVIEMLPKKLVFLSFKGNESIEKELKSCENDLQTLYRNYLAQCKQENRKPDREEFNALWRNELKDCLGIYKRLSPRLYAEFEAMEKASAQYKLESIITENIYFPTHKGAGFVDRSFLSDVNLSATSEKKEHPFKGASFVLKSLAGVDFKIWSDHYSETLPGSIPPKELYIVRLTFKFRKVGTDQLVYAEAPVFVIEV